MKTLFVLLFIFALSIASSCSFFSTNCGENGDYTQRYFEILNVSTIKHISRESTNGIAYVITEGESVGSWRYKGCQINFNMRYYAFEEMNNKNNNGLLYACSPMEAPAIYSKEGFKKISVYTIYPWESKAAGEEITDLMLFNGLTYDKFNEKNGASTYTTEFNIIPKSLPESQNTGQYLPYQIKVVFEMTDGKRIESISPRINFRL